MKTLQFLTVLLFCQFISQAQDSVYINLFKDISIYEPKRDLEKGITYDIAPVIFTKYEGLKLLTPIKIVSYDISTNISFTNFIFNDTAQFKYTKFLGSLKFENTQFDILFNIMNSYEGGVNLDQCIFKSTSIFYRCNFEHFSHFNKVKTNSLLFNYSSINDGTFENVEVLKNVSFYHVNFKKKNKFINCSFNDTADFSYSHFNDEITFDKINFDNISLFKNCIFNKSIDFSNSTFNNYCTFNSITLTDSSKFNFKNVTWADTIDFSEIQNIKNEIDFSISNFTNKKYYNKTKNSYQKHLINLYKTDISKLHIDYYHFKLLFVNPEDGNALSIDETKSIYEAVLKNFKDRGQMESYKLLDIEYKDYIGKTGGLWKNIFAKLSKYWDNYGYEKWWVFIWTILFIFIYTIITFFWFDTLSTSVYILDTISTQPNWKQLRNIGIKSSYGINLITTRLWYSFIYTSAIFFLLWLKIDRLKYDKKLAMIYLMLVYITGIICIAYMANYVLQK